MSSSGSRWWKSIRSSIRRLPKPVKFLPLLDALEDRTAPAAGDLDLTFGASTGKVTLTQVGDDEATGVAIDSNGRILVSGSSNNSGTNDFFITRFTSAGVLDTTFGGTGKVFVDFGGEETALGLTIDASNNAIISGFSNSAGSNDFAIARVTSSGSLDTTFSSDGKLLVNLGGNDIGQNVALDANGKILVAGFTNAGGSNDFALVRITTAGDPDSTFGTSGFVTADLGGASDIGISLAVASTGQIYVGGQTNPGANFNFAVMRFTAAGAVDTGYGSSGWATVELGGTDYGSAITLNAAGNVLIAGSTDKGGTFDFAVAQLTSTGALDTAFGTNGQVVVSFGGLENVYNVQRDTAGNILVVGTADISGDFDFAVARFTAAGVLDTTFGGDGKSTVNFTTTDRGRAMAISPTAGSILIAGPVGPDFNSDFGIAQLEGVPNTAPTGVSAGGPYTISEGGSLSLSGTATDAENDTLTYAWDVNGDGKFTDATGKAPTLSWAQLLALTPAVSDGPATFGVRVQVSDGVNAAVTSSTVNLTVNNTPPILAAVKSQTANDGVAKTISLGSFSDPGVDGPWAVTVVWGDGTPNHTFTMTTPGSLGTASHIFTKAGTYTVAVVVVEAGGTPAGATSFTVTTQAINDAPILKVGTLNVSEATISGASVGKLSSTDPDLGQTTRYAVSGGTGRSLFSVSSDGTIRLIAGKTLNFEQTRTYTLSILATDNGSPARSSTGVITINVTNANDSPVITKSVITLPSLIEDAATTNGVLVSTIANSTTIADQDAGAKRGIAITFADPARGVWQFSRDGGRTWGAIGTVSETAARLLLADSLTRIRLVLRPNSSGSTWITFRAWDASVGTNGGVANVSANGGSTAYSSGRAAAQLLVRGVNDAPVLLKSALSLPSVLEDAATVSGVLVESLINSSTVRDVDGGTAKGVVITGADTELGDWEYSTDNGTSWKKVGAVSKTAALSVMANARTKLRHKGKANKKGKAKITFKATDSTAAATGTRINASTGGGTSSLSSTEATVTQDIIGVNDAPVNKVATEVVVVPPGTTVSFTGTRAITVSDVDSTNLTVDILFAKGSKATGTFSVSGSLVGVTGNGTGRISFTGTIQAVNDMLSRMSLTGGTRTGTSNIRITTNDGALSDLDIFTIRI